jgi:branched-subunit amino acid aminotransferase/4-amino-4-deoxychorismate lyase
MHVFLNGRIVPESRAFVGATDPAVLYGFGVFEVVHLYPGGPFRLRQHLARLRRSARRFGVKVPVVKFDQVIRSLCARNGLDEAYVRITLTAGGAHLILALPPPPKPPSGRVRMAAWSHDPRAPLHGHKTLNYLENYLVRNETRASGYAETLFRDLEGRLLEGTVTNLFLVKRGVLLTPRLRGILPGVTRMTVLEIAKRLRIPAREADLRERDLLAADEAFLTSTMSEVHPITAVERRPVRGPGPITERIAAAYRALTSS